MSITFKINQEDCTGCALCVPISQEQIKINDAQKAYFVRTGEDIVNLGTDEDDCIFAALEACPANCIKQWG